jgi:[CysO sulfur-carrier protein]-S-L-cysteine hydrolase
MIDHARTELPNECCGLLAGKIVSGNPPMAHAERRLPLVNALASPVEYLSEPRSMFEAVREIDRLGLDMLAVYHSHPTSEPIPSRKDREQSYSPNVVHLIISLKHSRPQIRGWWLSAENQREATVVMIEDS